MKKKAYKFNLRKIFLAATVLVIVLLIFNFVYIAVLTFGYINNQYEKEAFRITEKDCNNLNSYISHRFDELEKISVAIASADSSSEAYLNLCTYQTSDKSLFDKVLCFSDSIYDVYGNPITYTESDHIYALQGSESKVFTPMFTDVTSGTRCFALYIPVKNNNYINGIVGFIYYDYIDFLDLSEVREESELSKSLYIGVITDDGTSVVRYYSEYLNQFQTNPNIYEYLYNLTESKKASDSVRKAIEKEESGVTVINIKGPKSFISYTPVENSDNNLFIVNISSVDTIILDEGNLFTHLVISSVVIFAVLIVIFAYFSAAANKYRRENERIVRKIPFLGCNNYNRFVIEAEKIISGNKYSNYALIYFNINKFKFISEKYSTDLSLNILKFTSKVLSKLVKSNETFCHMNDDVFVAMFKYNTFSDVSDRIRIMQSLINNYKEVKNNDITLKISIGIYLVEIGKKVPLSEMIDKAEIAQKYNKKSATEPFVIFTESVRQFYHHEAEIESRMETALKNKEFEVFYQPKYNLFKETIDSAEALVRWYNPETQNHIAPDEFINVFESNGFIKNIDHFIFIEVCKLLRNSVDKGERTFPLSVNVSRVTAIQEGFVDFYVNNKKKYGIADGFIIIEFTESFALGNYDAIRRIVSQLQKNGFKCSIDDFGSGYSSLSFLKDLPMDELKLDKFFIHSGNDKQKDDILLSSIIKLAKAFGMKVIQEGVESKTEIHRLKELGCDAIQGYLYSKPLRLEDYKEFIKNN